LFKKVILADNLAQFVTPAFAHVDAGGAITTSWAWLATLAYTLQLYFDFSGYSDMAIGLALMFGIRLPVNFRSPYKATSIVEFWRRWHITLSRFLRDYLYIPLGGNRRGPSRRYINLMVTMLLGGLWHGAGWTYVVWGGLHGLYLCVNQMWRERFGGTPATVAGMLASWTLTFLAVVVAWVFFRAATMNGALTMLQAMIGVSVPGNVYQHDGIIRVIGLPLPIGADAVFALLAAMVALGLAIVLALPNIPQIFRYREFRHAPEAASWLAWRPSLAWAVVTALAFTAALFGMWQRLEFLYFQF
jgi:D-alanyl-lipoteichoic acid acyltransferase DltB (MBOAT superfamily)